MSANKYSARWVAAASTTDVALTNEQFASRAADFYGLPQPAMAPLAGKPVFDAARAKEMPERAGVEPTKISPIHNVRAGLPPTIIFHGKDDPVVRYETIEWYRDAAVKAENRCELVGYADEKHGFFNHGRDGNKMFEATMAASTEFLESLGWIAKR